MHNSMSDTMKNPNQRLDQNDMNNTRIINNGDDPRTRNIQRDRYGQHRTHLPSGTYDTEYQVGANNIGEHATFSSGGTSAMTT